jgi:hypothetical protein
MFTRDHRGTFVDLHGNGQAVVTQHIWLQALLLK